MLKHRHDPDALPPGSAPWSMARVLLQPLWIFSLGLLLVNDHVLKGAGLLPSWLTGKLSDFAGYLIFPGLLAALVMAAGAALSVRSLRRHGGAVFVGAHLVSAALLLALELSPALCALIGRVAGVRMWPDPTDLLALSSIAASYLLFRPVARDSAAAELAGLGRGSSRALLGLGCLACAATSPAPPPPVAEMFLHNATATEVDVRLSLPRRELSFDCGAALASPEVIFTHDMFRDVQHLLLSPDGVLFLDNLWTLRQEPDDRSPAARACNVVLLSISGQPERLVVWRSGAIGQAQADVERDARLVLSGEGLGGPVGALHPGPLEVTPSLEAVCTPPRVGTRTEWSTVPGSGPYVVRESSRGADGCDALVLTRDGADARFYACAEPLALPFAAGEVVRFREPADGQAGVVIESDRAAAALVRATDLPSVTTASCPAARQACGATSNGRVRIPTPVGETAPLAVRDQVELRGGGQVVSVAVTRVEQVLLHDAACAGAPEGAVGTTQVSYVMITQR